VTPTPRRHTGDLVEGLEVLVQQARSGQPGAMSELVRRFTPLVRAVVRRSGVFGVEAEDVEQETWLRLTTNLDRVREPAALPRWLSVTAGRLCSSLYDRRRRVQPAGDFSEDTWLSGERLSDPADMICLRDEVVRLYDAIDTLTPRDRKLVRMLMDSAPYREISATISMPVGSIGPTRERVLRKLAGTSALRPEPRLVPAA
jgi:RNA polymerase sigma factor (sigma-70 family)